MNRPWFLSSYYSLNYVLAQAPIMYSIIGMTQLRTSAHYKQAGTGNLLILIVLVLTFLKNMESRNYIMSSSLNLRVALY